MTIQNYLIVESNVVTNEVVWDGNVESWTPPANATTLVQEITPAMIWEPVFVDSKITDWVLTEEIGAGGIGFTWDGSILTTNQPKPEVLPGTVGLQSV